MQKNNLSFQPLIGLSSKHLQMIVSCFLPKGKEPSSQNLLVDLGKEDYLSCEISTPYSWKSRDQTMVLIHGMGGSHSSSYMIRMSRKLYLRGFKVVRVNLRGCGSGAKLSKLPYNAGTSLDVLKVLEYLKKESPNSDITAIGFSLGGNVILKLAGELGQDAKHFVKTFIAVCPPLDLAETERYIQEKHNRFYHNYYLKWISKQALFWSSQKVRSLREFADVITAPLWGYRDALDYYQKCSSIHFLPKIAQRTHLLFAKDDPFIGIDRLKEVVLPSSVNLWITEKGGHMGFLGKNHKNGSIHWMDEQLLLWVEEDGS